MTEQGPLSEFGESRVAELENQRKAAGTPWSEKLRYYAAIALSLVIAGFALTAFVNGVVLAFTPMHGVLWEPLRGFLISVAGAAIGHVLRAQLVDDRWWWEY